MGLNWLPNAWASIWQKTTQWALKKNFQLGQIWAQQVKRGPRGPAGRVWAPKKKNPINIRAGSGFWDLARGSGPGMQKLGPNPTRCHP